MTLQRTNPVPKGFYWLDVFAPKSAAFQSWLAANKGAVGVRSTEHFEANAGGAARDFVVLEVKTPVQFPFVELGFPTVASSPNLSSADTVQRPPPEPSFVEGLNPLASAESAITGGLFWLGALTLVGVGLYAFASRK